jgi:hypothetical protein
MVNYCTTIQDMPASKINLLDNKEQEVVHLESKIDSPRSELFVFREKNIAHDISHIKGLHKQECKYREYLKLF